ncbi:MULTISPECIES: hypothetical protein [unclassified Streptomyces]|uniref:hypothetical protein n=1 Tax=unclassified Streptomyces TaxID=2593676 RepID=UPI00055E5D1C|nr:MULTISPECIES: hypothetical protein [unclassified Streptomyces]
MLVGEPAVEIGVGAMAVTVVIPPELMVVAEVQGQVSGGPVGADLAGAFFHLLAGAGGWCGAQEVGS